MSKHTIPTELNIAPRGKSWLNGQLIDGEHGHPTRQSMEGAERAQAIQCTCPSGDGSLHWPCPAHPPAAVPGGWQELAARVMDALADAQDRTNAKYPEHVKCYPTWETRPRHLRWLAEMFRTGKPIGNGAGQPDVLAALAATPAADKSEVWPCINIDVDEAGNVTSAKLYSPGLPAGNHDVYPVRVPYMDEHTEAWMACHAELCRLAPDFMRDSQLNGIDSAVAAIRHLAAAAAPVVLPEHTGLIAEKLLALARIVNTAVEDWGESSEDNSMDVKFHSDVVTEMDSILDYFDRLPDGPDENVIESGPAKAARILRALLAGVSAPAAQPERKYICPVRTIADLVNNLMLMDQALPIYGAQYIEHPPGKRRAIAVPPTVSIERVKDSRWIGEGEALNTAIVWTRAEQPASPLALTPAARDVMAERARQISAEGYDREHDDSRVNDEIAAMAALFLMPEGARDWDATSTSYGDTLAEALLPTDWEIPNFGDDRRRQLVKGTAMGLAEIERLDRAAIAAAKGE